MADWPVNEENGQRLAVGYDGNQRAGYNLQLHDQSRNSVANPRTEFNYPIQENQQYLGQAVSGLQSLPQTDGGPTIHIGVSSQDSEDVQLPDVGVAVRPFGSVPVYQDVLPMISNGGVSFPPSLQISTGPSHTDHGIQETSQGAHDQTGTASNLGMRDFERNADAKTLSDSDVSMESEDGETTVYIHNDALNKMTPKQFFDKIVKTYDKAPDKFFSISQLHPMILAKDGLSYTGEGDKVKCYCCGFLFEKWEKGDDPVVEHIRLGGPEICPHLLTNRDPAMLRDIQLADKAFNANPPQMSIVPEVSQARQMSQEVFGTVPKMTGGMDAFSSGYQASGNSSNLNQAPYPGQSSTTQWYTQLNVAPPQHLYGPVPGQPNRGFGYRRQAEEPFTCQDCHKNQVNHTQLKCGHNICSQCMDGYKITTPNLADRRCKTCHMPILGYASYAPGCQN